MRYSQYAMRLLICGAALAGLRDAASLVAAETSRDLSIPLVATMPNLPEPFTMRDWTQVTRDYIEFVFDFDRQGDHLPLVRWKDRRHTTVSLPSYVGGPRGPEAINYLGAVVSGALVGIDMRDLRGQDWVALGTQFYNIEEGVYANRVGASTGKSFWYDIFPNVLLYQVNALYPDDAVRDQQAFTTANKWYDACVALGGSTDPPALPNFDHTGLKLSTMEPTELGWIEPEAAAGVAWLEYMAWVRFQDPRFLTSADWAIRSLEAKPVEQSPLYEVLLPYGALAAARMNAELGKNYDVGKLVNECFDARGRPQARPGWGVISDRWQGQDVHGLVGSTTDGEGYAFAMNTFEWAGAIVPIVRYDTRYARDVGKWMLNLANASRLFYPNAHDAAHQSSYAWTTAHDADSVIAYEGIRKWKRGVAVALSDYRTTGGHIVQGNSQSTHAFRERPHQVEVLEEDAGASEPFQHLWEFELPAVPKRWLVVAAERVDGGHLDNSFQFSFANHPDGPYIPAFSISDTEPPQVVELPAEMRDKLYVKAESRDRVAVWNGQDQLVVDAMAISYCSDIGPFAQGDKVVSFVDLLDEATAPIVLYRPESAATDLGLYGSGHVGILGGIIQRTSVECILQLDLLKTDYFHAVAYPTFLYYNPYAEAKSVDVEVGEEAADIYDAVSGTYLQQNVRGRIQIKIPADSAIVTVIAPTGRELHSDGKRTLIGDVVVRYSE